MDLSNLTDGQPWFMAVVAGVIVILYFLPALIAARREKNSATGIFVLNLFLGWTFIGWVVALIWSFANDDPKGVSLAVSSTKSYEVVSGSALESRVCTQCKSVHEQGAEFCLHCGTKLGTNQTKVQLEGEFKNCPFCAETIKFAAIKCKHCGSVLQTKQPSIVVPVPATEIPAQDITQEALRRYHKEGAAIEALRVASNSIDKGEAVPTGNEEQKNNAFTHALEEEAAAQ